MPKDCQNVFRLDENRIQREATCDDREAQRQCAPVVETVESELAAIEGLVAQKHDETDEADSQHSYNFVSGDEVAREEKRYTEKYPGHFDPSH